MKSSFVIFGLIKRKDERHIKLNHGTNLVQGWWIQSNYVHEISIQFAFLTNVQQVAKVCTVPEVGRKFKDLMSQEPSRSQIGQKAFTFITVLYCCTFSHQNGNGNTLLCGKKVSDVHRNYSCSKIHFCTVHPTVPKTDIFETREDKFSISLLKKGSNDCPQQGLWIIQRTFLLMLWGAQTKLKTWVWNTKTSLR